MRKPKYTKKSSYNQDNKGSGSSRGKVTGKAIIMAEESEQSKAIIMAVITLSNHPLQTTISFPIIMWLYILIQ
ncbi:MAG: hypothetical protein JXR95_04375 [Deltaproteobacteria bacterium]|nr:hypothetical protein [Deltaproteobacteria bacterium]